MAQFQYLLQVFFYTCNIKTIMMYTECPICIPLSVLLEADGCIASMECAASSSKRVRQLNASDVTLYC